MKFTHKFWLALIINNIPKKYKYNKKYVSLRTLNEDWNGFDFNMKDLPLFYNNEPILAVHIYDRDEQLIDTIMINIPR